MKEMKEKAKVVSNLLKSISNENRLLILCELSEGPKSVGELVEKLEISQSGISQHLLLLKANGILKSEKKSQTVVYQILDERIYDVMAVLKKSYCE